MMDSVDRDIAQVAIFLRSDDREVLRATFESPVRDSRNRIAADIVAAWADSFVNISREDYYLNVVNCSPNAPAVRLNVTKVGVGVLIKLKVMGQVVAEIHTTAPSVQAAHEAAEAYRQAYVDMQRNPNPLEVKVDVYTEKGV